MPTQLVTPKMHPALAARVLASVTGRRLVGPTKRRLAWLRLLAPLLVVAVLCSLLVAWHRERAALASARQAQLRAWQKAAGSLGPRETGFLDRAAVLLSRESAAYAGDVIAPELRENGALDAILARPLVYVRGPLASFGSRESLARVAGESNKDTLLLCLMEPPAERTEKSMMVKVRLALAGGSAVQALMPRVGRLADAIVGMPYLDSSFAQRLEQAEDRASLQRLEREFKRAPLDGARRALRAELLLAVYDEPNDQGGVTELDGEHAHQVRVALIEVSSAKVWLRQRRHVDPSWVTPNRRSEYARELDGCKLSTELRAAITPDEPSVGAPQKAPR